MHTMNFKKRSGFLLLEAVFATFIVGIIIGPLFISQNNILMYLSSGLARMQRLYIAKDFLMQTVLQQSQNKDSQTTTEKKVEDPSVNLIFKQEPIASSSALAGIKHLYKAEVTFGWEWANKGFSDRISTMLFRPPKEDSHE